MSKQVQLRRGTTAQHSTFTGAQGEITFDTEKDCLVVHDGITPGGKPVSGFVLLDPNTPLTAQEVKSPLYVSGGDLTTPSLSADHDVVIMGKLVAGPSFLQRLQVSATILAYAPTVNLDFDANGVERIALSGNITLTTSNVGPEWGKWKLLRLDADASPRTLAFPAGWIWVGSAAPTSIAANKKGILELFSFGSADADIVARWTVQP